MPQLLTNVTGRFTRVAWWCNCGTRNEGSATDCVKCSRKLHEKYAQIRESERAVVYVNPLTGERRTPARNDEPVPEIYARQGFERQEIMSITRYERETGSIHESTTFNPGNEPVPETIPKASAPKELIKELVDDIRAAHQSGAWTMDRPLSDMPISE